VILTLAFICAPAALAANHPYNYANGTSESAIQSGIQALINSAGAGDTVTVTGNKTNVTNTIMLDIKSGVTVIWGAVLSGSGPFSEGSLLKITGAGAFQTNPGANITATSGNNVVAIWAVPSSTVTLNLNGGTISSNGSNCFAVAIDGGSSIKKIINVNGATISVNGSGCCAIIAARNSAHINLNGGSIIAYGANDYALYLMQGATYSGSGTKVTGQIYTEPSDEEVPGGGCDAGVGGLLALSLGGFLIFKKRRA
jgi:hypothetical protein